MGIDCLKAEGQGALPPVVTKPRQQAAQLRHDGGAAARRRRRRRGRGRRREYPWCAVIDYGDGGVSWECNYRTIEECYPNVLAGNKGTCTQNPAGGGPQASAPAVSHKPHKRHVQQ
jgi:hypothetical protein